MSDLIVCDSDCDLNARRERGTLCGANGTVEAIAGPVTLCPGILGELRLQLQQRCITVLQTGSAFEDCECVPSLCVCVCACTLIHAMKAAVAEEDE